MCLTRTIDLIDFENLGPEQLDKIREVKQRLSERKEALLEELAHIDEGLGKLDERLPE